MDSDIIFEKTTKGVAQLAQADSSLPAQSREALKLVDGRRTVQSIATKMGVTNLVALFGPLVESELVQRNLGLSFDDDRTVRVR